MRGVALIAALLLAGSALADELPSNQTLVFYNARIALREDRATDVLRFWLLRNALVQRGEPGLNDPDFRSVVWASLGKLGLCQDGLPQDDEGGAGLWALALHNYLVQSINREPPESQPAPWEAFEVKRQQRMVSLHDVLSDEELRSVSFFRTNCYLPQTTVVRFGARWLDMTDRLSVGLLMRDLLQLSKTTVDKSKVQSLAAVEARIFDLDLALAALQEKKSQRDTRALLRLARQAGVSKKGAAEVNVHAIFPPGSKQAELLTRSLTWSPSEWLMLNRQRRLSLFSLARPLSTDEEKLHALELGVIDQLIEKRMGDEVEAWLGFMDAEKSTALQAQVTEGKRGDRLLELDPSTGFHERSVIALHRGVGFLQRGELQDSLKSFAYALQHAEESREGEAIRGLARRWLSFVLSRYETSDEVIATLKALVPRQEYNAVIEDLVWRAAFRADAKSFNRLAASSQKGGSFEAKLDRLRPLAEGDAGAMATRLRNESDEQTHAVLGFAKQFIERMEQEDADVRRANVKTLRMVAEVLKPIADGGEKKTAQMRNAEALIARAQSILDALDELDLSEWGRSRAMSPRREAFAGNVRLAPADALPWPFRMPDPEPPSAFTPLNLDPVEWRDEKGALVFGWRVSE